MVRKNESLAQGHLGFCDIRLNKLGKGPPNNDTYHILSIFLAPEPYNSGKEVFKLYFIFEPKTSAPP